MVVLYNLNIKIDTTALLERLPLNESIIKIEKRGVQIRGESSRDKIKRRSKNTEVSKTGFGHNSITIVLLNDGGGTLPKKEITVKIFQNGVFHMTGVLDERYDTNTLSVLMDSIWKTDCFTERPDEWKVEKRRVVLMNYTSDLKHTVAREALCRSIRSEYPEITVSYDPDVYPGVKIQFQSKHIAKVFRTGKIILTGVTSHDDCCALVDELNEVFKKTLYNK
jgi:TATA-box binding protein (TBP) (component of TFIID and TFIIIB)